MDQNIKIRMGPVEWILLITLSIIWGGSFFFNTIALGGFPTFTVVLIRVGLGGLVLLVLVYAGGGKMPGIGRTWLSFFIMGFMNNMVPFCLIVWGQNRIAGGLASVINASAPVFTVVLAHYFTKDEKMTAPRLIGVLVGLTGVAVLIGPDIIQGIGKQGLAQLAILGAALSYASAGIFGRRFKNLPPLTIAAGQVIAGAVLLFPVAMAIDRPWTLPSPGVAPWAAAFGLAIICTSLAYVIYFRILAAAGATNLLLVTLLIPVSATSLGAIFLHEPVILRQIAGMAVIASALAIIDGRVPALLLQRFSRGFGRGAI